MKVKTKPEKKIFENTYDSLENWIENNGMKGYDVCDINAEPFFLLLSNFKEKVKFGRYIYAPFYLLQRNHATSLRKLLRVKKNIFPQAIGLIARAYMSNYSTTKNINSLKQALNLLNWLEQNTSEGYSKMCWGQPYNWSSRKIIPKNTPRATVTSIITNAFLDAYELTKKEKYLVIAKSSCDFFINDLNLEEDNDGDICFSYTSKDNFTVHNANMVTAATLIRTWSHCRKYEYKNLAIKALNFTIKYQNKDGSWYYWAPPEKIIGKIDNYHTGFILEAMEIIKKIINDDFKYDDKLELGIKYYVNNFFNNKEIPKMYPSNIYPIDIQSCAQSIITFLELSVRCPHLKRNAINIALWTIKNMFNSNGYFYYRFYENGMIDKTPYIRWSESWMLRALSFLILTLNQNDVICNKNHKK